MTDTTIGLILLGTGILFVLGLVFAITSRASRPVIDHGTPPPGVHVPPGSYLPSVMPLGGALIFAGLAFRPDDQLANFFLLVPGLVLFVVAIVAWVRDANREWVDAEHRTHDDAPGH